MYGLKVCIEIQHAARDTKKRLPVLIVGTTAGKGAFRGCFPWKGRGVGIWF